MPTVILLDTSLSMLRPVECGKQEQQSYARHTNVNSDESLISCNGDRDVANGKSNGGSIQLLDLAKWGIDKLLTHFEHIYKLEQVAVLSYSSQVDLVVPFTRDISDIRGKVNRKITAKVHGTGYQHCSNSKGI